MKRTITILLALGLSINIFAQDRITGKKFATRSEVIAQNGMAATSHPLATQVALDILKKGGNAIDAAIAANACLGLMEPVSNGIGGDLFAIVWDAKAQKLHGLNGSGRSPKSLTLDYFLENGYKDIPAYGPLPVSVPGCHLVRDWWRQFPDSARCRRRKGNSGCRWRRHGPGITRSSDDDLSDLRGTADSGNREGLRW